MQERAGRLALFAAFVLLGAVAVAGLALVFVPKGQAEPLVATWQADGFHEGAKPQAINLPKPQAGTGKLRLWRSWTPETLGTTGRVASAPFRAPRFMAIPHYGGIGETPGNRVFLRCLASGQEFDIATARAVATWATAYLRLPRAFCPGKVQLVATSTSPAHVVGVGTPLRISAASYYAHTAFPPRALAVAGSWGILVALMATFAWAGRRIVPSVDSALAGFAGLGATAMLVFLAFHAAPPVGRGLAIGLTVFGLAGLATMAARDRPALRALAAAHGRGVVLWLGIALAFAAFWGAAESGGGSWAINSLFSPARWSSDNQLPFLFAEKLDSGFPREAIRFGGWLASDRTPLLTALYLLLRPTLVAPLADAIGPTFTATAYMLAATVILTSWVPVLDHLSRRILARPGPALVFLAAISPFFAFNSVYAWGKLLGGTCILLTALGLVLLRREGGRNGPALAAVAIAAALAYLSHGGNAFAAIGVAIVFAATILRQGIVRIAVATLAAIAVAAPWLWWQTFVQPGGDALIRFALTGVDNSRIRAIPLWPSIVEAYERLGASGWIAEKGRALGTVLGLFPHHSSQSAPAFVGGGIPGAARIDDVFLPARSLGFPAIAGLALLLGRACLPNAERPVGSGEPGRLALAGLVGLLLMLAVTLAHPITHVTAYGSLALLFVGGAGTLLAAPRAVARTAIGIGTAYFAVVWVWHPLTMALRLEWSNLTAFFVLSAGLAWFALSHAGGRDAATAGRAA